MQQMSELLPGVVWPHFHPSGSLSSIRCPMGTWPGLWSRVHSYSQVTIWSMPSPKGLTSASCSWQASGPDVSLSDSVPSGKTCYCGFSLTLSLISCQSVMQSSPWIFLERISVPLTLTGLVYIHRPSAGKQTQWASERLRKHSLTTLTLTNKDLEKPNGNG